ncbi:hypothetical protein [Nioella halotolerans]|uniref:hypothetical protein n=1 Tax=Nioella halotolerans TaxID=2303578 RepID=UPI003F657ECE
MRIPFRSRQPAGCLFHFRIATGQQGRRSLRHAAQPLDDSTRKTLENKGIEFVITHFQPVITNVGFFTGTVTKR